MAKLPKKNSPSSDDRAWIKKHPIGSVALFLAGAVFLGVGITGVFHAVKYNEDLKDALDNKEFIPSENDVKTIVANYLQGKQGFGVTYDADALTYEGKNIRLWFDSKTKTGAESKVSLEFVAPATPFKTADVMAALKEQANSKDVGSQPIVLKYLQDPSAFMSKNGNKDLVSGLAAAVSGKAVVAAAQTTKTTMDGVVWYSVEKTISNSKDGSVNVSMYTAKQDEEGVYRVQEVGTQNTLNPDTAIVDLTTKYAKSQGVNVEQVQQALPKKEEEAE